MCCPTPGSNLQIKKTGPSRTVGFKSKRGRGRIFLVGRKGILYIVVEKHENIKLNCNGEVLFAISFGSGEEQTLSCQHFKKTATEQIRGDPLLSTLLEGSHGRDKRRPSLVISLRRYPRKR